MKISKNRNSAVKRFFRNVIDYRYIKRNAAVIVAVAASVAGICTVVKYGEALDHADSNVAVYAESVAEDQTTSEEVTEVESTEEVTVNTNQVEATTEASEDVSAFEGMFVAQITGAALNIRQEASTDSTIVGKLLDGNVGEILETDGDWVKISSGDVVGYVNSAYILTGDEAEEYAANYKTVKGTTTVEGVRVRAEASTDAKILTMASEGTTYTVTAQDDSWVEVTLSSGTVGYVAADYIDVVETYDYAMTMAQYMASVDADSSYAEATTENTKSELSASTVDARVEVSTEATTTEAATTTTEATTEATTESSVDPSSYSDAYLLACLVSMEAGNESYEGQLAVANVVINRLNSGAYGSTMYSVIYASGQFPSVTGSVMEGYLKNGPTSSAQQAANAALAGTNNIGSFTRFANAKYVDTDSLSDYIIIGNHCFY